MRPSIRLFFTIFKIYKSAQEVSAKQGWVSFGQMGRLFTLYSDSMMGFKRRYFCVVVENDIAYRRLRRVDSDGGKVFWFPLS